MVVCEVFEFEVLFGYVAEDDAVDLRFLEVGFEIVFDVHECYESVKEYAEWFGVVSKVFNNLFLKVS